MRIPRSGISNQRYTRYANKTIWLEALDHRNPEEALIKYFSKHHGGPNELKMAIDNVKVKFFQELLSCCIESVNMLSKYSNSKNIYFMNQIIDSTQFIRLFSQELEDMEEKYQKRLRIDNRQIQNDKKFIQYFLNFAQQYVSIQPVNNLQKYLYRLESTLKNLCEDSNMFNEEQNHLNNILQKKKQVPQQRDIQDDDGFQDISHNQQNQEESQYEEPSSKSQIYQHFIQASNSEFEDIKPNLNSSQNIHSQIQSEIYVPKLDTTFSSSSSTFQKQKNEYPNKKFQRNLNQSQIYQKVQVKNQNDIRSHYQKNEDDSRESSQSRSEKSNSSQSESEENLYEMDPVSLNDQLENEKNQNVQVLYKKCPIEPSFSEFQGNDLRNNIFCGDIFKIPIRQPFKSTEIFLNNHFFILREDYVKNFRKAVSRIKREGLLNTSVEVVENAFLYHQALVENILVTNKGLQFLVTMSVFDTKDRKINWKRTRRLMPGSLLLLSCVNLKLMLFGTVLDKPSKDDNGRVSVVIQLIGMKILQQLQYINMLLSSENQLVVIENQVYYETYTHFLKCLQNINTKNFPFVNQLVLAKKEMPLPGYIDTPRIRKEGIEYDIDLKFNLHQQSQVGRMRRINILRDWNNINVESLDESQLKAIQIMLRNGISLIQGPPGTGKTFCGALGVRILLQNQFKWNEDYKKVNKPILIVCQTNHALDQFLQHILTFCRKEDIVRIGGRCKVEEFKDMLLNSNQQSRKVRFSWGEFLHLRENLEKKLKNLLNLIDNVNYLDVEAIIPNLSKLIIQQYLVTEDLQFVSQLSNESRKFIIHMWLDTFKPRKEQAQKIIEIESQNRNYPLGNQQQRQDFKAILQNKQSDLLGQIYLSQESKEQLEKNYDDEVDENDGLDSEEEENRRLYGLDDGEKNAFVNHLIQDKKTLKRLVNRLDQGNINSFMNIMEQDLNSPNVKIWEMPQNKRNVITRFIFTQKFQIQFNSLKQKIEEYDEFLLELKQAYLERDLQYIQTKKIVGVTLAGCAKYAEKFQNLKFNILIIEEAGEVLESKLVSVLTKNINHLILIGDHQQLKPHLECYDLECKYRANISLFERLIRNGLEYVTLNEQRRMKTKFANFIRLIYRNYKDHTSISEQNAIQIQGLQEDLLFFNHDYQETQEIFNNSKSNAFEAEMIVKLTNYLLQNKTKASQITVLCTYVKQALKLQKGVKEGIKVQTVDNYQGEENDIIILSLVRSNKRQSLGFVGIDNRVCVAFSRARIGFYVFGDFEFIEDCIKEELNKPQHLRKPDISDLWLKIISYAYSSKVMFDHIPLKCSSHNEITKIRTPKDWDNVKGGGCTKPCLQKFPCGHPCDKKCHQSDHRQEDCRRECEKILICGHQCTGECSKKCPPCLVKIEKIMPKCLHKSYLNCSDRNKNVQCFSQCEKQLPCGHQCELKCYDDCSKMVCYEEIIITLQRCKHQMKIKCSDQKYQNQLICQEKCQENLFCGHNCSGNCGTCFQKFHSPCKQQCDKILNCGHKCKLLCKLECYQCKEKCQIECNCGDKCLQGCDKDCRQCSKPCKLQCQHSKCNKQCFEICDREPCNEKCQKILDCGCQCMGFCGEVCPKTCLDSNHDTQIALKNTIYYQIECECKLIMEAEAADNYFNQISTKYFIRCPGCDKIIWKSSRYQDKIKQFKKVYYEEKQNKRLKYEVNQDRLEDLKELVMRHLEYVQKNNIKDEMGFLDTILQDIKNNLRLMKDFLDPKFTYQEFMCIKAQLELYQKALILKQAQCDDFLFKHHRQNILQNYLLNEEYRKTFSSFQQWKVEQKLDSLLLYHEFTKLYKDTKKQQYQTISFQIEDSQFFLGEDKNKELKLFLLEAQKS